MLYQPPFKYGVTPAVPGIHNDVADAPYVNGDPALAVEGSYIPCEAVEHVQREILEVITWSGQTPNHADLTQLRKALQWAVGRYLITTPITITIGGTGPLDQPTLAAAIEWLSTCLITSTGSVVVQLAAGQMALGATFLTLSHPDGRKITLQGAVLTGGGFPADANITITGYSGGQRTTDTAAALAVLRARIPTELQFTGGGGLIVDNWTVKRVLTTHTSPTGDAVTVIGDATIAECAAVGAVNGVVVTGGSPTLDNVMAVGVTNCGVLIQRSAAFARNAVSCYSSASYGIVIEGGGALSERLLDPALLNARGCAKGLYIRSGDGALTAAQSNISTNGNTGIDIAFARLRLTGAKINGNASHGALVGYSASLDISPVPGALTKVMNNGGLGLYAVSGGKCHCGSGGAVATITGNTTGAAFAYINSYIDIYGANAVSQTVDATDGSFIRATAATTGTLSPTANTLGNSNSYIKV